MLGFFLRSFVTQGVVVLLPILTASVLSAKDTVSVAAAADLVYCLDELDAAFQKAHPGTEVKATTGSSGNFFAQIKNGAPFDVFLSADMSYPQELINAGLADEKSLTQYAIGRIVVWTTKEGFDISGGIASLANASRVAIANPDHAPYGKAAKSALEHFQLWEKVQPKIVLGDNIAQTAQFIQTGNAEAGIVALSLVLAPKLAHVGKYVDIPVDSYPKLIQGAVITKQGMSNASAALYIEFLRSKEAREIFDRYGFRQ